MSYILHLDTSTDICGTAVSNAGNIVACITTNADRNHAAIINRQIDEALQASHIGFDELSAVVVCSGPGSYTGLRIAMATAKGICYAKDKPLLLNDRLTLLIDKIYKIYNEETYNFAALLKAREGEYFIAIHRGSQEVLKPQHMMEKELIETLNSMKNLHIITDVSEKEINKLKVNFLTIETGCNIDYKGWANKAYLSYVDKMFVNTGMATPLYLKQVFTRN